MAALALGVPVVSCLGDSSERLWAQSAAIALAPNLDALEIAAVAQRLIYDTAAAAELGRLGQALYRSRFDLRYTTEALRAPLPATSRRLP